MAKMDDISPADYMDTKITEVVKITYEELYNLGYTDWTKASLINASKSYIKIWMENGRRFLVVRARRKSHHQIVDGEIRNIKAVKLLNKKTKRQFYSMFIEGLDNHTIIPLNTTPKRRETRIKDIPIGKYKARILKRGNGRIVIKLDNKSYLIKEPRNNRWIQKRLGEEFEAWVDVDFRKIKDENGKYIEREFGMLTNSLVEVFTNDDND